MPVSVQPGASILIVDDDDNDLILLRRALMRSYFEGVIETANSGAEAIDYLSSLLYSSDRRLPAMVLTDLKMPVVSGFDIVRHIRGTPALAAMPVIIMSSSAIEEDIRTAYALGANSFFTKPPNFEALQEKVAGLYRYWRITRLPGLVNRL
jgi:CheY-like chemotaxis protein